MKIRILRTIGTVAQAALIAICFGPEPAGAQTDYTWSGPNGGSWSEASNWTPNGVPGGIDSATLGSGRLDVDSDWTVGALTLAGGTIQGGGVVEVVDSFTWTSGSLSGAGVLRVPAGASMEISGTTTKSLIGRRVEVAGAAAWEDGSINTGQGAVLAVLEGGSLSVTAGGRSFTHNSGGALPRIENAGEVTVDPGDGQVAGFQLGFHNNGPTGSVELLSGELAVARDGASAGGTWAVSAGATLTFTSGIYSLTPPAGGVMGDGTLRVAGGRLTVEAGGGEFGFDRVEVTGGTAEFEATSSARVVVHSGGTLGGGGRFVVGESHGWTGGGLSGGGVLSISAGASMAITESTGKSLIGRRVEVAGAASWENGNISTGQGAVLAVLEEGSLSVTAAAQSFTHNSGGALPRVENAGEMVVDVGDGQFVAFNLGLHNNGPGGSVEVLSGELHVARDGTSAGGEWVVAEGSILAFASGTISLTPPPGGVMGAGTLRVVGGRLTVEAGGGDFAFDRMEVTGGTAEFEAPTAVRELAHSGGTLGGGGAIDVGDAHTWTGGGLQGGGALRIPAGASLSIAGSAGKSLIGHRVEVAGAAAWEDGSINTGQGAVLAVLEGGSLSVTAAGQSFTHNSGGALPRIENAGEMVVDPGAGQFVALNLGLHNNAPGGSVEVLSGDLIVARDGTSAGGEWAVAAGAMLSFTSGTNSLTPPPGGVVGAGALRIAGGRLTVEAGGGEFGFDRVEVTGGTVEFEGASSARELAHSGGTLGGGGVFVVGESHAWTGGGLSGGGVLSIATGATMSIAGTNAKGLIGRRVEVSGSAAWEDGNINTGQGAVLAVREGGSLSVTAGGRSFTHNSGGALPRIENAGEMVVDPGAGQAVGFNVGLHNSGSSASVDVRSGELALGRDGASDGGAWAVAEGASLAFGSGTYSLTPSAGGVAGDGTLRVAGGRLTVEEGGGDFGFDRVEVTSGTVEFGAATTARELAHSGGTLDGSGEIVVGESYDWTGGTLQGGGVLGLPAGATMAITGTNAKGLLGRRVEVAGSAAWEDGNINTGQGAVLAVLEGGSLSVTAAGRSFTHNSGGALPRLENAGEVVVDPGDGAMVSLIVEYDQSAGSIRIAGGTLGINRGFSMSGGDLLGDGTILGDVVNSGGRLAPGAAPGTTGTITIDGDYTQGADASLAVDVTGAGGAEPEFDQVVVTGAAMLGGSLAGTTAAGFAGELGGLLPVLTAMTRTGSIAQFSSDSAGEELYLDWRVRGSTLFVQVSGPAPTFVVGARRDAGGTGNGITFTLKGIVGLTYAVETTTELLDPDSWTVIFTGVMPGNQRLEFVDPDPRPTDARRWYRGAYVPVP